MSILVITTGGTIGAMAYPDPAHPPSLSIMPPDGRDIVREVLADTFAAIPCRCVSLDPRDSKLFDDAYREQLAAIIAAASEETILVTHGTDALLATVDYLHSKMATMPALQGKTIVLTGAMVPLANGGGTDGYLNLAFALQWLQAGQAGSGLFIVLCDVAPETGKGWTPRLYPFVPGRYRKYYDPADASRSRIVTVND